jgi:hypothetical protein
MLRRLSEEGGRRSPSCLDLNEVVDGHLEAVPSYSYT